MAEPVATRGPYRTGLKRREQIITAATAAFARRGYAGASLRQIADQVGMTSAGLLRHFNTKEDLLTAVLDRWAEDTDQLHHGESGLEWFLQYADLMRYHEEHPGLIELFLTVCGEASDPHHPARPWVTRRYVESVDLALHHLRIARQRGEIKSMTDVEMEREVRGLYALMDGLELQWITNSAMDLAKTFDWLFTIVLDRWRA